MKFQMEVCSDCSYPPNWVATEIPCAGEGCPTRFNVVCRDCGDAWVEQEEDDLDNLL